MSCGKSCWTIDPTPWSSSLKTRGVRKSTLKKGKSPCRASHGIKSQSTPVSPARKNGANKCKTRSLPISSARVPHPFFKPIPKKNYSKDVDILKVDRQILFKHMSVGWKSTDETSNFSDALRVITVIRTSGGRVWDSFSVAKESLPELKMVLLGSPDLRKMSNNCSGRSLVLLHTSLYTTLKLTLPTVGGRIVIDGWITPAVYSGILGQSIANFQSVCV